ncbi:MAG: peptide chain release factor N(5)-glutamine methyltransferase [Alphaproteobacteria bacterium]|nr:peptide chain release factor N(5)-glutamine methyltransferase [Alphaproteobacteria bacterium]
MREAATDAPKTIAALSAEARRTLEDAGVDAAAGDVRVLLAAALDRPAASLIGAGAETVSGGGAWRFRGLIARRAAREPVSRILGRREFWSLDFAIDRGVLDPRADSECLVEAALQHAADRPAPLRVADLGVGSGCLLLSVLHERARALGVGVDRAEASACTARRNAAALGLADRALIVVGDWTEALGGPFDLLLANPPYIPSAAVPALAPEVRGWDPIGALDGGADGLDAYRAILPAARRLLAPGGAAILELGAGQWSAVADLAVAAGLRPTRCVRDAAGIARCLVAETAP